MQRYPGFPNNLKKQMGFARSSPLHPPPNAARGWLSRGRRCLDLGIPKENGHLRLQVSYTATRVSKAGVAWLVPHTVRTRWLGTAASPHEDPASQELAANVGCSSSPARGSNEHRAAAERGEPLARDLQKEKVCNLAAVRHTPGSSCPCSRHLQDRRVPPQSRTPRVRRAKKRGGVTNEPKIHFHGWHRARLE